jgi:hypothetical protein
MDDLKQAKIQQFINDRAMSGAVFDVLLKYFIKPKPNAFVNEQAASFIAIGLLQEVWKELERFKLDAEDSVSRKTGHV